MYFDIKQKQIIRCAQNNSNHVCLIWNRKTIHAKKKLINHGDVLHRLFMICSFLIFLDKTQKRSTQQIWRKSLSSKNPPKNLLKISNDANPIFFRHEFYANLFILIHTERMYLKVIKFVIGHKILFLAITLKWQQNDGIRYKNETLRFEFFFAEVENVLMVLSRSLNFWYVAYI